MAKPKISKIVIEVSGKRLEFTPEEAKELKSLLGDLFGEDKTNTVYVDRWSYPKWPYYTPSITTPRWSYTCQNDGVMLCSATSNNTLATLTV